MQRFETTCDFPFPVAAVFRLLSRPGDRPDLSPPDLHLEILEAPEEVCPGARIVVRGRRWGLARRVVTEVTACADGTLLVEEQREGPFRSWAHTQRFEPLPGGGTRVRDTIAYEPPGGMLGLTLTPRAVERELERVLAHRNRRLADRLAVERSGERLAGGEPGER